VKTLYVYKSEMINVTNALSLKNKRSFNKDKVEQGWWQKSSSDKTINSCFVPWPVFRFHSLLTDLWKVTWSRTKKP